MPTGLAMRSYYGQKWSVRVLVREIRMSGLGRVFQIFDRFLIYADFDNFQIVEM